jgi:hypothetical protein
VDGSAGGSGGRTAEGGALPTLDVARREEPGAAQPSPEAAATDASKQASKHAKVPGARGAFRMFSAVRVPSSRRMRQRKRSLPAPLSAPIAIPLSIILVATVGGCSRSDPPQWDAGAGVSLAIAPLPIDAASAPVDAAAEAAATAPEGAPTRDETGKLPQTHARPDPAGPSGAPFEARVRALFEGIAQDDVARAMPFFFPLPAYAQVKAIANPAADWKARLVAHYARDIHALHAKLGPNAARARFVAADVPMDRARWVDPGEEYNRIGYFRVYGTKLRGEIDGAPVSIDVTSLISWRGEWFVVHLTGVK